MSDDAMELPKQENVESSMLPTGLCRAGDDGEQIIDAMAGRASLFGFGFQPLTEAISTAAKGYLGDGGCLDDGRVGGEVTASQMATTHGGWKHALRDVLGDSTAVAADHLALCASADLAVEQAISLARTRRSEKSFRTIALVGADHGRTAMCRAASGRPELHQDFGPMMAGFSHVPAGDLDALRAVVDDQTACILLSPVDFSRSVMPCEADYLRGVRELCDQRDILLVVDETRMVFGSSGRPLAFSAIAKLRADVVALSAGIFGGMPGGIVIASQQAGGQAIDGLSDLPLQASVAAATFSEMTQQELPATADQTTEDFVVALAEQVSRFEFVRDVNHLGMTIGIELDIESSEFVAAARGRGLRLEAAGDVGIRMQPPIVLSDDDRELLLGRIGETMDAIGLQTAELSV